jgi:hypothetical protein
MASTLIIGIGTTGLRIIEEAQQFHYEFTGKNKPGSNVEYLFLETNVEQIPRKTATGKSDINPVGLSLHAHSSDIYNLKSNKNLDTSWVPKGTTVLEYGKGAGGMPSYGRLALWGNSNYNNFCSALASAYQRINGNVNTQILIVGSLTGGTGTGLCVDIAYLVQKITNNRNVNAVFLLPDRTSVGNNSVIHENCFGALSAITHYSNTENTYKTLFPDGTLVTNEGLPYQIVQYISQDFAGPKAQIKSLSELIRVAGMICCGHILNTDSVGNYFYHLIAERRIDSKGHDRIKNIISSGFLMLQYPKAQLEEIFAIDKSKELLSDLIDHENFFNRNRDKTALLAATNEIISRTNHKLEEIVERIFEKLDSLNTSSGVNFSKACEEEVNKIISNTHGKISTNRFLYELFYSDKVDNYFKLIMNNSRLIKDTLIEETNEYCTETFNEYKNFYYTKKTLESIKEYIQTLKKFYFTNYKLTGENDSWDNLLQMQLTALLNNETAYTILGHKKSYLNYVVKEISTLLKLHAIIPALSEIEVSIDNTNLKSTNDKTLPTIKFISDTISSINDMCHGDNQNGEGVYSLQKRRKELISTLDQNNSCFKVFYTTRTLDGDISVADNKYKNNTNKLDHQSLLGTSNIWDFFIKMRDDLYICCIENSTSFIKNQNLFNSGGLENILKNLDSNNLDESNYINILNGTKDVIKSSVPAMIALNTDLYGFANDDCARLLLFTNSYVNYRNLFSNYTIEANKSTIDIPALKDTLIIYQEYGFMQDNVNIHFSPLKHLSYMNDLKIHIGNALKNDSDKFIEKRVPYLTLEQFKQYLS